jgi:hypothetical protein
LVFVSFSLMGIERMERMVMGVDGTSADEELIVSSAPEKMSVLLDVGGMIWLYTMWKEVFGEVMC